MSHEDLALDWLINWTMAQDKNARDHYFHICEENANTCACPYEGEGTE